jgi:hypothetical protein
VFVPVSNAVTGHPGLGRVILEILIEERAEDFSAELEAGVGVKS